MTTGGLVVLLVPEHSTWNETIELIASARVFEIGERFGSRLALVLQTDAQSQSHAWLKWLESVPGVCGVEVAFVHSEAQTPWRDISEEASR